MVRAALLIGIFFDFARFLPLQSDIVVIKYSPYIFTLIFLLYNLRSAIPNHQGREEQVWLLFYLLCCLASACLSLLSDPGYFGQSGLASMLFNNAKILFLGSFSLSMLCVRWTEASFSDFLKTTLYVVLTFGFIRMLLLGLGVLDPHPVEINNRFAGIQVPVFVSIFSEPSYAASFIFAIALCLFATQFNRKKQLFNKGDFFRLIFPTILSCALTSSLSGYIYAISLTAMVLWKGGLGIAFSLIGCILVFSLCIMWWNPEIVEIALKRILLLISGEDGSASKRIIMSWVGVAYQEGWGLFFGIGGRDVTEFVLSVYPDHPRRGQIWNIFAINQTAFGLLGTTAIIFVIGRATLTWWPLGVGFVLIGFSRGGGFGPGVWAYLALILISSSLVAERRKRFKAVNEFVIGN